MYETDFLNIVRHAEGVNENLTLCVLDAVTHQGIKYHLDGIVATAARARLEFAEFYENDEEF